MSEPFFGVDRGILPVAWVPPWKPHPVEFCAVEGCWDGRVETYWYPFGMGTPALPLVRRYCARHCAARASECKVAGPAPVVELRP